MKFRLRPILSEIKELYLKPISNKRFEDYISKLHGDSKGDLALPIGGFNPMAKQHIIAKIDELEKIEAEKLMEEVIEGLNSNLEISSQQEILVVLNIADDLKGGWTNYYTTDFDSKFKLNAFVKRNFCVPYFWTSEVFTEEIIRKRTKEYVNRIIFRLENPQPVTLEQHLEQEIYVATNTNGIINEAENSLFREIETYFLNNKHSDEYDKIFNFFYGDKGSENLGFKKYGIKDANGYDFAKIISERRKTTPYQCV